MNKNKLSSYKTLKAAKKFSRRTALKRGAAVAALVGTGPIFVKNAFAASSGTVSVFAWMDYIQPNIVEAFENHSGIKVNLATFGSNDEAEQKTKASQGKGFDVIFPSVTNGPNYQDPSAPNGIWLGKLDEKKAAPALNNIIPSFLRDSIELGATYRGDRYLLPFDWGTEGITFNSAKKPLSDEDVSYASLWDADAKGKISFRQKSLIMGTGLYLDSIGVVPSNRMLDVYKSEEDADRVWGKVTEWIVERKDQFGAFWNNQTESTSAFKDAGVIIGQTWDTTGLLLNQENPDYKFRAPKEGIITWLDSCGLTAGAENIDEAYEFINFIYTPEMGGMLANNTGYNSAVAGFDAFTSDTYKRQFTEVYRSDVLSNMWWWQADTPWFGPVRNKYVDIISNA